MKRCRTYHFMLLFTNVNKINYCIIRWDTVLVMRLNYTKLFLSGSVGGGTIAYGSLLEWNGSSFVRLQSLFSFWKIVNAVIVLWSRWIQELEACCIKSWMEWMIYNSIEIRLRWICLPSVGLGAWVWSPRMRAQLGLRILTQIYFGQENAPLEISYGVLLEFNDCLNPR